MADTSKDAGILQVTLENFQHRRLPRLLEIEKRVRGGAKLNEAEMVFLQDALEAANELLPLAERHPEVQELYARAVHLYEGSQSRR